MTAITKRRVNIAAAVVVVVDQASLYTLFFISQKSYKKKNINHSTHSSKYTIRYPVCVIALNNVNINCRTFTSVCDKAYIVQKQHK